MLLLVPAGHMLHLLGRPRPGSSVSAAEAAAQAAAAAEEAAAEAMVGAEASGGDWFVAGRTVMIYTSPRSSGVAATTAPRAAVGTAALPDAKAASSQLKRAMGNPGDSQTCCKRCQQSGCFCKQCQDLWGSKSRERGKQIGGHGRCDVSDWLARISSFAGSRPCRRGLGRPQGAKSSYKFHSPQSNAGAGGGGGGTFFSSQGFKAAGASPEMVAALQGIGITRPSLIQVGKTLLIQCWSDRALHPRGLGVLWL